MRSEPGPSNQTVMSGATWLASFAIATLLGLGVAYPLWSSRGGINTPLEFWDRRVIEPQLIPWLVWATFAPPLMQVFETTDKRAEQLWSRIALYALLAIGVTLLHAAVSRVIRGSELWRCQPDGRWRIARYVSAPEAWRVVRR